METHHRLANDVKVVVKGTPSAQGLKDAAGWRTGPLSPFSSKRGGRKVKELHVTPAPAARRKKGKASRGRRGHGATAGGTVADRSTT